MHTHPIGRTNAPAPPGEAFSGRVGSWDRWRVICHRSRNATGVFLAKDVRRPVRTITADNGTEFHGYATIEQATGTRFYFATPHHAWGRGTYENTNGLIRQYLPERVSMKHLTQHDCNHIAAQLNRRPRKRLGYRTPEECYAR